jgi:murein DD-endopeptidase MepM/ murein hydrolase activator NlpD
MGNWIFPVKKVKLGSLFGAVDQWHKAPGHRGTDYNGFAVGEPLLAVNDGTIVLNRPLAQSTVLGNVVVLKTDNNHYFGYCHMNEPSPLPVGTVVKSGDVVGKAGNTGSASFGCHLHFTLSTAVEGVFGGKVFNAHDYIKGQIAKQKTVKPVAAPVAAPAHVDVKVCPTCKQEIAIAK